MKTTWLITTLITMSFASASTPIWGEYKPYFGSEAVSSDYVTHKEMRDNNRKMRREMEADREWERSLDDLDDMFRAQRYSNCEGVGIICR